MEYPCNCKDMVWMMDNNKVFVKQNGNWMLTWMEMDKSLGIVNVEKFGVVIHNCMFCGKKIKF